MRHIRKETLYIFPGHYRLRVLFQTWLCLFTKLAKGNSPYPHSS